MFCVWAEQLTFNSNHSLKSNQKTEVLCFLRKARGIFRLQISDFGLHTSKFRLQISKSLFSGGEANIETFLDRTSQMKFVLYYTNALSWICIGLAQWKNNKSAGSICSTRILSKPVFARIILCCVLSGEVEITNVLVLYLYIHWLSNTLIHTCQVTW
jgi:hypothetical protein